MTWTARSLVAFGAGLFAVTLSAQGLYHLIGTPGCESTLATPVRCSEESGWWALVLGGALVAAAVALRAVRVGPVRRVLFAAQLLGLGVAPLWAVADDRADAGWWVAAAGASALLGVALLAGLAAAGLRAAREPGLLARSPVAPGASEPGLLARPPAPLGTNEPPTRPAPAQDAPAIELAGEDPFGRDPDEPADPFGRGG